MNEKNAEEINPDNEKRIKFFHAVKWYPPVFGGIETVAVTLTGSMERAENGNSDVTVLACRDENGARREKIGKTEVYKSKTLLNLCSMPVSFGYLRDFRKLSKDADIIQLHAPFPLSDLALWLCGGRRKAKKFVWWHSDVVKQKKLLFFYKPLMKWMLKKADGIFVASESIITQSSFLGKYKDKIIVIPFGTDKKKYENAVDLNILAPSLPDTKVKLLFVGRLVYYKGVSVLLEAMKKTEGAELFIVGAGQLEAELREQTKNSGLENKVHFLGAVEDEALISAFTECDVFVLPSISKAECFGLVQLEAMACGKPVINTALPTAVPEVSVNGQTGLTVEPGNAEALAEAMNKLISDAALRESYGKAALERCENEYSLELMQKRVCAAYEDKLQ